MEDLNLKHRNLLFRMILQENKRQLIKWGIQRHTLPEWLMITDEEYGEMCKAINEYHFRNKNKDKLIKECIQTATLCLKIAEMCLDE